MPPSKFAISAFPRYVADQPPHKLAKLQYTACEALTTINAASIYQREFRANDLYDPDYAVGGHQPFGFDQLTAQYYHFTVLYADCELSIQAGDARNVEYRIWQTNAAGQLAATYAASSTAGLLEEQPHSNPICLTSHGSTGTTRTVRLHFDAPKTFGKPAADLVGDSRFQGDDSHSPTEDAYFAIGGYHLAASQATMPDATIKITITYYAVFTEPKKQVSS